MKSKKMNIVTWIAQSLLSLALLMGGLTKLIIPYEDLIEQMPWTRDMTPTIVLIIGMLEVFGVLGMNLPFILRRFKQLVLVAAGGLALTMMGAIITHVMRGENFVTPLILLALAVFVGIAQDSLLRKQDSQRSAI